LFQALTDFQLCAYGYASICTLNSQEIRSTYFQAKYLTMATVYLLSGSKHVRAVSGLRNYVYLFLFIRGCWV